MKFLSESQAWVTVRKGRGEVWPLFLTPREEKKNGAVKCPVRLEKSGEGDCRINGPLCFKDQIVF